MKRVVQKILRKSRNLVHFFTYIPTEITSPGAAQGLKSKGTQLHTLLQGLLKKYSKVCKIPTSSRFMHK